MIKDITKEKIRLELERSEEAFKGAKISLREELFDESVSSAYYSMFHAVKAVLLTLDLEPSTHQGVVILFGLHFIKPGIIEKEYNNLFIEAKDDREESDYNVTRKFTKKEAAEKLENTVKFKNRIYEYLKEKELI